MGLDVLGIILLALPLICPPVFRLLFIGRFDHKTTYFYGITLLPHYLLHAAYLQMTSSLKSAPNVSEALAKLWCGDSV